MFVAPDGASARKAYALPTVPPAPLSTPLSTHRPYDPVKVALDPAAGGPDMASAAALDTVVALV